MPFPNQLLQPIRRGRMLKSVTRYSRRQSVSVILSKLSGTSVFIVTPETIGLVLMTLI